MLLLHPAAASVPPLGPNAASLQPSKAHLSRLSLDAALGRAGCAKGYPPRRSALLSFPSVRVTARQTLAHSPMLLHHRSALALLGSMGRVNPVTSGSFGWRFSKTPNFALARLACLCRGWRAERAIPSPHTRQLGKSHARDSGPLSHLLRPLAAKREKPRSPCGESVRGAM